MRDIKKEILKNLAQIEDRENVRILHAVESGSRAWGVESPDSDYDVRFIYVRPKNDYLKLEGMKDIIEWKLDDVLDINGWDIKKALIQFRRGNATLFEWAQSPEVYKTTKDWDDIYQICKKYFSKKSALYHYYGTANSTYRQYLLDPMVRYKKYIYALRPLLACRYIENNGTVPPVRFEELLKQDIGAALSDEIEKMLLIKAKSGEKALNPQLPAVQEYIKENISVYEQLSKSMEDDRNPDWETLDRILLDLLLI